MRIAMFSWESLHSIAVGGVAPHVTELSAGLRRRGHEVHVFTRRKDGQAAHEEIYGVQYHRVNHEHRDDFVDCMHKMCDAFSWSFGETEALVGKFDIVHAHDWMACKAMVNCKNNHGSKCVFTFHSTEPGRSGGEGQGDSRVHGLEGEASYVADRIIAVSDRFADEVRRLHSLPGTKVWAIPNGIQCARFDGHLEDPASIKRLYDIGPLDPMVLFVGRMVGGMKGGDLLMEAVPAILGKHNGTKVVFVGDGDNKLHCEHRAREMNLQHACRFLGPKSGNELVNLFKVCDCVATVSRYEPFGITVLEGWAAGKPVVVTTAVGCPVDHGHNGWVVEANPPGIAWGIGQVLADFNRAKAMGANGRSKAAFSFSWDCVADTTERVYNF